MKAPAKYTLSGCTKGCSLNPENLPAGVGELVHRWFEEGANNPTIIERAAALGAKLSNGSVGRHRSTHLHAAGTATAPPGEAGKRRSDLEVVDALIQRGAAQVDLSNFKVTAEQLLRAIELKHKLTEGSVFDELFAAMAGEEDLSDLEGESAIRAQDEQAQAAMADGDE